MKTEIPMKKLPYKIMLDRYSQKDLNKKLMKGMIVVATVDETDPLYPQKEICEVVKLNQNEVALVNLFDSEETYNVIRDKISVPTELTPGNLWTRMALANAFNEIEDQDIWFEKFYSMLNDWGFVPGGRIMAMLGADNQSSLTAFNCFVIPSPEDSRHGAIASLNIMTEIMARGGGVGINLSTLRPRHAIVRGVQGTSSGSVSWGGGYSYYTGLIEQGGSRRGALLEGLGIWHPDIIEFITVKKNQGEMLNANLSVLITEDFMQALANEEEWILEFPDTSHSAYNSEWKGNLTEWKSKGYPTIQYDKLPAKSLWDMIMEGNWTSADPGVIWMERYNNLSNSWYFEEIVCTNPCGEQGLPPWGVCNLGHINLSRVPLDPNQMWGLDWTHLEKLIRAGVRFMDNVIDITPYFFDENKQVQSNTRRIGIGTMGFAELLIRLKIRYGSTTSLDFIDSLYAFIRDTAYDESVEISRVKGPFPMFNADKYLEGGFVKTLPDPLRAKIREYGIRNVAILTQAPTGSTGTMCDTSTGIEPFYDWVYIRRGRLGTEIQYTKVVEDYFHKFDIPEINLDAITLPEYFVTAKQLTPEEHVSVMARIQKYTDSSISKTVNCPAEWTIPQVDELYRMAYKLGCKGLTIYRDKSKDSQVLESIDNNVTAPAQKFDWGELMPKPHDTIYRLVKFNTGCGRIKLMIGTAKSMGNRVVDIYTIINSEGGCQLNIQGEAITISRYLRLGGDIHQLLENSTKAGNCPSYQFKRGQGNQDLYGKSCFHGVVKAIVDFQNGTLPDNVKVEGPAYEGVMDEPQTPTAFVKKEAPKITATLLNNDNTCPSCGKDMVKETGCWNCKNCGFNKCE